jgi:hypothetical protein
MGKRNRMRKEKGRQGECTVEEQENIEDEKKVGEKEDMEEK